jgi:5-deoxy-glucuronate isomerase
MAPASRPTIRLEDCVRRGPTRQWKQGFTDVVSDGARDGVDARMRFGIHALPRGRRIAPIDGKETLCVLLRGRSRIRFGTTSHVVERTSLFDEGPSAVHAGPGQAFEIVSETSSEWAIVSTDNTRTFPARFYRNDDFTTEDRGAGLAQGACRRLVRTIFDHSTRRESNLVVGEVVNFPGRWSSYPPHHHPQPEIYHYRFTEPQGYGHAELGDAVFKVRDRDTVFIPGGLDHAQVSAPGYGMYYLWIVRHLPRRPYKGFTYTKEHTWLLDPARQGWSPDRIPTSSRT